MKIKRLIILLIILQIPTFVNAHTLNTDVISTETTISKISDYVDLENVLYKKDDKGNFTLTGTIKNKLAIKTKFEIKINNDIKSDALTKLLEDLEKEKK